MIGTTAERRCSAPLFSLALVAALIFGFGSHESSAHVIMGTKSLHLRVAEVDLVVRAKVTDPEVLFVLPDGKTQRRLVEIRILESLKGSKDLEKIRFAQDGHDVPVYQVGEDALFFLDRIERSRELRALAIPGGPSHVSSQEHSDSFRVDTPSGEVLLAATRMLAASETAPTVEERIALVRQATLDLLTSGDAKLGASALASLVLSPNATLVRSQDVPQLERVLADPKVSIGFRAGLLAELERRGLVEGPPYWLALLESASRAELPAAIRAAGVHPSTAVEAFLLGLLARTDNELEMEIAAEAAIALGASRNDAVVPALEQALTSGPPRLRNAAIRGLGQIGSAEARDALERAAAEHPDPATRRRAAAAARRSGAPPNARLSQAAPRAAPAQ